MTARPAPGAVHGLLAGLRAYGAFHATPFETQGGVAVITRDMRRRCPFVHGR